MSNELTTQELEELVRTGKPTKKTLTKSKDGRGRVKEHSTILAFIKTFQVQRGEIQVPTFLIYFHYYVSYTAANRAGKVGKKEFFRTFSRYFESKRTGKQRYYMLNDSLDMTEATLERAKKHKERYQK